MARMNDTPQRVMTRAELLDAGLSGRGITTAIRDGRLIRLRRDRYVTADRAHADADGAVAAGGRLTCISLMRALGVFALRDERLHVRVAHNAGRLRGLRTGDATSSLRVHWMDDDSSSARDAVSIGAAVCDVARCCPPTYVVATLDSLLHRGVLEMTDLLEVFACLPRRFAVLSALVDPRAESGIETLVRLMLRRLGVAVELQVRIDGVGRVDLLVDGWLIIECDSREFHGEWDDHRRDRRRDMQAVALGYTTVRLLAEDVLYRPDEVFGTLRRMVTVGRRG